MVFSFLSKLFGSRRDWNAARQGLVPRKIRIHSITPPPEEKDTDFHRVAFEFLDPPGPYSMQFYEARPGQEALRNLAPGTEARYYESRDGAKVRLIETGEGTLIEPR